MDARRDRPPRTTRLRAVPRWLPVALVAIAMLVAVGLVVRPNVTFTRARSDAVLRAEVGRRLARQPLNRPFRLAALVPGPFTTLWIFGGYTRAADIERAVGRAWDGAPTEIAEGDRAVVVAGPGDTVRGFLWTAPRHTYLDCLPDGRALAPADEVVRLGPVPGAAPSSSVVSRSGPRARRACARDSLAAASTPGR